MPRSWPLPRKTTIWVTRPSPGGHSLERCMPVNLIVRDVLGRAQSSREVRYIVHKELVKVDGRVCKDTRRGVGLMDVLSLGDEHFRCMLDANGRLRPSGRTVASSRARARCASRAVGTRLA